MLALFANNLFREWQHMNIAEELEEELSYDEYSLVERYILDATEYYNEGNDFEARENLEKAIAILKEYGMDFAAETVESLLEFC